MVSKMAAIKINMPKVVDISCRAIYFVPFMIFNTYLYELNMYVFESLQYFDFKN